MKPIPCDRDDCKAYMEQLRMLRTYTRRLAVALSKVSKIHGEPDLGDAARTVIQVLDQLALCDPQTEPNVPEAKA